MKRREALALGVASAFTSAGLLSGPVAAKSSSDALAHLFLQFGNNPGLSANFIEEKRIALLEQPIINHGRLYFKRPAHFARHIDKPFPSAIFLRSDELVLWDGSTTRVISLEQNPAVAALATSFVSLLQGDPKQLEQNYHIRFSGSYEAWLLKLLPKHKAIKRMIRSVSFRGSELSISEMRLAEATGDSSYTRFENTRSGRVFTEDEKLRYFSPPEKR